MLVPSNLAQGSQYQARAACMLGVRYGNASPLRSKAPARTPRAHLDVPKDQRQADTHPAAVHTTILLMNRLKAAELRGAEQLLDWFWPAEKHVKQAKSSEPKLAKGRKMKVPVFSGQPSQRNLLATQMQHASDSRKDDGMTECERCAVRAGQQFGM